MAPSLVCLVERWSFNFFPLAGNSSIDNWRDVSIPSLIIFPPQKVRLIVLLSRLSKNAKSSLPSHVSKLFPIRNISFRQRCQVRPTADSNGNIVDVAGHSHGRGLSQVGYLCQSPVCFRVCQRLLASLKVLERQHQYLRSQTYGSAGVAPRGPISIVKSFGLGDML